MSLHLTLYGSASISWIPALPSARAGEASRVEGLQAGADDYLLKPFSSCELIARIETQLLRGRVRALEQAHRARLMQVFAQGPAAIAILRVPLGSPPCGSLAAPADPGFA